MPKPKSSVAKTELKPVPPETVPDDVVADDVTTQTLSPKPKASSLTPLQVLTRVLGCGVSTAQAMLTNTDNDLKAKLVEIYTGTATSKDTLIRQLFVPRS